jgi:hypothetical protein
MSGVADQESSALRQARDDPPMHPKRSEPPDIGGTTAPAKPAPTYIRSEMNGAARYRPRIPASPVMKLSVV